MKLSAKERQRYAHILPLLEKENAENASEEKEIVVRLKRGWMILIAIFILAGDFLASVFLWVAITSSKDNFEGWMLVLFLIAIAVWSTYWWIKTWTHPIIAIVDEEGVYIGRKDTKFTWDEIDHLSFANQTVAFGGKNSNPSYEQWFWCVLKNGDKFYARINSTNYTLKTLHKKISKVFPEVKCKTNGEL